VFSSYYHAFTEEENKVLANCVYGTYIPQGLKNGWIIPTRVGQVGGDMGAAQGVEQDGQRRDRRKFIVNHSEEYLALVEIEVHVI
jgi:hypothetical protein